ncbi:MAG: hypothetical protein ABR616_19210 [Dermatophilaceae bacterium]
MPDITIANSPEALAAARAFSARTDACIADALDATFDDEFCSCSRCVAEAEQYESETWAENAWLREAERGR